MPALQSRNGKPSVNTTLFVDGIAHGARDTVEAFPLDPPLSRFDVALFLVGGFVSAGVSLRKKATLAESVCDASGDRPPVHISLIGICPVGAIENSPVFLTLGWGLPAHFFPAFLAVAEFGERSRSVTQIRTARRLLRHDARIDRGHKSVPL